MENLKISIVVCCYRGEDTIEECLYSLLNQNQIEKQYYEVIVVDDGSMDRTSEFVNKFIETNCQDIPTSFRYFRKHNEGLSVARNYGIAKSNSNIVSFIDEDAVASPDYAFTIVDYFENNQKVNCVGGTVDLYNSGNEFARLIHDSVFSYMMKSSKAVIGTNMAFRKSIFVEVGGFQPEFTYRGDETAFFAKAKDVLHIGICESMKVKHCQPSTPHAWLITRYENGYYGAAKDHLIQTPQKTILFNIIKSLSVVGLPLFMLIGLTIILFVPIIPRILIIVTMMYMFSKIIISLRHMIFVFRANRNNQTTIKEEIYISALALQGYYREKIGYIRGCFYFRNVKWTV